MKSQPLPLACVPGALGDGWAAHTSVLDQLRGIAVHIEQVELGLKVSLPRSAITLAAEFIQGEAQCCPFFTFRLVVPPGASPIELEVTCPDEGGLGAELALGLAEYFNGASAVGVLS